MGLAGRGGREFRRGGVTILEGLSIVVVSSSSSSISFSIEREGAFLEGLSGCWSGSKEGAGRRGGRIIEGNPLVFSFGSPWLDGGATGGGRTGGGAGADLAGALVKESLRSDGATLAGGRRSSSSSSLFLL